MLADAGCSRRIREDLGGTYSIVGRARATRRSRRASTPSRSSSAAIPDATDDLVKRVFKEIEQLKTSGPDREAGAPTSSEALLRDFETNIEAERLPARRRSPLRYQYNEDPASLLDAAGLLQEDRRRDDPAGGEDVPEQRQLREGHAVPGEDRRARSAGVRRPLIVRIAVIAGMARIDFLILAIPAIVAIWAIHGAYRCHACSKSCLPRC